MGGRQSGRAHGHGAGVPRRLGCGGRRRHPPGPARQPPTPALPGRGGRCCWSPRWRAERWPAHQQRAAERARNAAQLARNASEALRLGTVAESRDSPSVALGLAAQALATDDSPATRVHVLETFAHFPTLLSTDANPKRPTWAPATPSATSGKDRSFGRWRAAGSSGGHSTRVDRPTGAPGPRIIQAPAEMNALGTRPVGPAPRRRDQRDRLRQQRDHHRLGPALGAGAARLQVRGRRGVGASASVPTAPPLTSYGTDGLHTWDLTSSRALIRLQNGDPTTYRAGDAVLSLTDTTVDAWIDLACQLAGRPLTSAEWREYVGDRPYRTYVWLSAFRSTASSWRT